MNARSSMVLVSLAAAFTGMLPNQAFAVDKSRLVSGNAVNFCQSALPVFDSQIRKRPLAVQNEGNAAAFVTCSFASQGGIQAVTSVDVWFASAVSTALSCTGVAGVDGNAEYIVKSVQLPANKVQGHLRWALIDTESLNLFSISCNLAPGVGIQDSYVSFVEDVGQ